MKNDKIPLRLEQNRKIVNENNIKGILKNNSGKINNKYEGNESIKLSIKTKNLTKEFELDYDNEIYKGEINKLSDEDKLEILIHYGYNKEEFIYYIKFSLKEIYEIDNYFKQCDDINDVFETFRRLFDNKDVIISKLKFKTSLILKFSLITVGNVKKYMELNLQFIKNPLNNETKELKERLRNIEKEKINMIRESNNFVGEVKKYIDSSSKDLLYDLKQLIDKNTKALCKEFKLSLQKKEIKTKIINEEPEIKVTDDIKNNNNEVIDKNNKSTDKKNENDNLEENKINLKQRTNRNLNNLIGVFSKGDTQTLIDDANKVIGNHINKMENSKNVNDEILVQENDNNKIRVTINDFKSKIIKKENEFDFLNNVLCKLNPEKQIKYSLLYRATRDGDKAESFHNLCNNNKSTLVLIKSSKKFIFGGYTQTFWNEDREVINNDKNSFCFSINLKKVYKYNKGVSPIVISENSGPIFSGDIIGVPNNFLKNGGWCGYTTESKCYGKFNFDYEISGGEKFYKIKELEVFLVDFE